MEFLVNSGTSTPAAQMSASSLKDRQPEPDLDMARY